MEPLNKRTAEEYITAWRKALPSQINDSFHQVANCRQERLIAFILPDEIIQILKKADDKKICLTYGYDAANAQSDAAAFKVLIRFNKTKKKESKKNIDNCSEAEFKDYKYYELQPLTSSSMNGILPGQIQDRLLGKNMPDNTRGNTKRVNVDVITETSEFISPVMDRYMLHSWLACQTSTLVDKVEALYNGKRVRIETSIYRPGVAELLLKIHKKNSKGAITLVHLGLHEVIPGDDRIFHFGPILQTYIPTGNKVTRQDTAQGAVLETVEDQYDSNNFELSSPCPPFCNPPRIQDT